MKEKYKSEIEAMRDFYEELETFGLMPDYSCNTDGRIGGTLIEIKLNNSGGLPIKQLKRYIKSYNAGALPIPRYSLFVNINQRNYTFINNDSWKIIVDGKWKDPKDLLKLLNKNNKNDYIKGWIGEFSIVSYNDLFYNNHLSAKKEDFIKEIEDPKELKIKPYHWNKTGNMERSILDCLGSIPLKKRLGAFFTPNKYVDISTEEVHKAVTRVPKGYDYVIVDRCAGTGNLERKLRLEELSHCILNTYDYAEWTTLKGLYEGSVRHIIPHTKNNKDPDGLLSDGDALTEDFNKMLTDIIEKEKKKAGGKLVIIGLENNPFFAPQAEAARGRETTKGTVKYISKLMHKDENISGAMINDLSSQFIWSMLNLYKPDTYIVYSPIKVWKNHETFITTKITNIHLCNRKHFHATPAAIGLFTIINSSSKQEELNATSDLGDRVIKRNHYQTRPHKLLDPSSVNNGFAEIIHTSGTPDYKNACLVNTKQNKCGRHISIDVSNILQALPLWVANCYTPKDYTEKEVIMKSGDGGTKYQEDKDFLNDCFVWACLINNNKCVSNESIRNELCLTQNTEVGKLLDVNKRNTKLLQKWRKILKLVKTKDEYNPEFTYGLHQICHDINTRIETGDCTKKNEPIMEYKYDDLNNLIKDLKEQLKEFYNKYIIPKLFKYELLK